MRVRLLIPAFALLAAACAGGTTGAAGGSGRVEGRIVVQVSGGEAEVAALTRMAEAFEQANDGVEVELIGLADPGEHISSLLTAFAGGAPPDVFLLNYRRLGPFVEKEVIEPASLGPISRADLYDEALDAFTFDGTLACLPQNVSSVVTYINLDLFAAAGVPVPDAAWTTEDALSTARALAAKKIEAVGFDPTLRTLAPFVWAAGGEVVDDTADPAAVTLDTAEARAAIDVLLDLQRSGLDARDRAAEGPEDRFARGELAMFFDSRRAVPAFRKAQGLDFDVRPLPKGRQSASLLASDGYCVTRASRNKATAQAFAQFAIGEEGGTVLAETGRTVPSLKALAQSEVFLAQDRLPRSSQVFLDVIPTLRRLPSVAAWNEVEEQAGDLLEQMFAGRLSVDATVERIEKETRDLLGRDR